MELVLLFFAKAVPGLLVSLQVTIGVVAIGISLGLTLALGLVNNHAGIRTFALVAVEIFRGIPALVMLYIVYFGLPQFEVVMDAIPSASVALGISMGGFLADVFKAGILAIPLGQREAAAALGLSRSTAFTRVILPQTIRIVTPPVLGYVISYFQATALAYTIAVPELMSRSYTVAADNFRFLEVLTMAGFLYAVICIPSARWVNRLSNRDEFESKH
ncbi:polar amino acid ABC transporter, inner membrane subunit (plasmid) [Rhizobium leguminosarum bv. trifolii WSM2304]|uniref:Polar amino acid ABC transporter, inner membrane subunit n=1 Tax=Rhizobium leguminosarum bv. trifolii (strain WSM2304) TaxID=395492 RepID=A0ABF7R058_RHILW|nr:amino acid ABC transporter permease [Rhizobium leguminosarum]ACI59707.1 polar amino acid ABC transporter, inner membrane subunit [Rhizobium leguminosarum bv. trifolii WSM2304]